MAVRQSVVTQRPTINQMREKITARGYATWDEQFVLLNACLDDACVVNLLIWLMRDVGMSIQGVILEIKTLEKAKPRPEALQLERERIAHLRTCASLPQQRVSV